MRQYYLAVACLGYLLVSSSLHAQEHWIYQDGLSNGWQDWSYSSTRDPACTDPVYSGAYSMSVAVTGDWGALSLHNDGLDISDYDTMQFHIYGQSTSISLKVFCHNDDTRFDDVALNSYVEGGTIGTGAWKLVSIPLSAFGIVGETITRIDWQGDASGPCISRARPPSPTFWAPTPPAAGPGIRS
ncbi:MAG: hypothetical protein EOM20_21080, partial [Spartobacteria bacterium]|nr:hypothetical protein [Spartobacteria bacterium]